MIANYLLLLLLVRVRLLHRQFGCGRRPSFRHDLRAVLLIHRASRSLYSPELIVPDVRFARALGILNASRRCHVHSRVFADSQRM